MKVDIEATIIDDGKSWIVRYGDLTATGETLQKLDDDFAKALRESGKFACGSKVKVFMGYNFSSTIPTWMRQYAYHYFNRVVTLDL